MSRLLGWGCSWHLMCKGWDAAQHPTMDRTDPQPKLSHSNCQYHQVEKAWASWFLPLYHRYYNNVHKTHSAPGLAQDTVSFSFLL